MCIKFHVSGSKIIYAKMYFNVILNYVLTRSRRLTAVVDQEFVY